MNVPIDIRQVVLTTDRLILRPWRSTDLSDFYEYASVDGVGQMAGWAPHESREQSQAILNRFIAGKKTFAIEYQSKVIGSLGIEEYDESEYPEFADRRVREIGFVLSKDYWGQGIMPEALRRVVDYLFDEVGLDLILCGNFVWNHRSARVQEKCGFRPYRRFFLHTQMGTVEDTQGNILFREDDREPRKI